MTTYDAIRVIQDGDDIKLKLNDATFSRTTCEQNCENPTVGRFVPYTMAEDCANGSRGIAGAYASLEYTPLKFPSDIESMYATVTERTFSPSDGMDLLRSRPLLSELLSSL